VKPGDYMMPTPVDGGAQGRRLPGEVRERPGRRDDPSMPAARRPWGAARAVSVYCLVVGLFAAYIAGPALGRAPTTAFRFADARPSSLLAALWQDPSGTRRRSAPRSRTPSSLIYGLYGRHVRLAVVLGSPLWPYLLLVARSSRAASSDRSTASGTGPSPGLRRSSPRGGGPRLGSSRVSRGAGVAHRGLPFRMEVIRRAARPPLRVGRRRS